MALAQAELRFWHGKDDDPIPAAERALEIDARLAEALLRQGQAFRAGRP